MLDEALANLYSGPLADFVAQRDALVKELRAAGKRDVASDVKSLRKPSRLAWALNVGVTSYPKAFAAFDAALDETVRAQTTGGDVRSAMAGLRESMRDFTNAASVAAQRAGHRIEAGALSNALLAVVGAPPESYAQLRSGHLAEVPEAGGLDFLANLPSPRPASAASETSADSSHTRASVDHENARRKEQLVASARSRSESAAEALRDAEAKLSAAEERLREAQHDVDVARRQCEEAQRRAEDATTELHAAQAI